MSSASSSRASAAPSLQDAAPAVDHRALGLADELGRLADQLGVADEVGAVAGQVVAIGGVPLHRRAGVVGVDDVFGDVHQHRTGAAGGGDVEGVVDHLRDVGRLGHQVVVLCYRHGDAGGVALLEGVGADGRIGNLAGDHHHGDGVHVGVAQRGDDIRGRRSRGDHGHTWAAGGVGEPLGHVAGALLMAHQHMTDRRVDQRVVHRKDGPAGQPEQDVHTLVLEGLHQRLTAVHLHAWQPFI